MIGFGRAARIALTAFSPSERGPLCDTTSAHIFFDQCSLGNGSTGGTDCSAEKNVELLRRLWLELPEPFHHRGRVGEFEHDRPAINHAHRMGAEEEAGHDAEISAAAAQSPQQVRVLRLGSGDEAAVGQNHVRLEQAISREAVLAAEVAVTAAQRQARDAGRREDPEGDGLTEGLSRVIDVTGRAARAYSHRVLLGVDPQALHLTTGR